MYTGVVLAGGQSSRMGTDKALLSIGQVCLIEQIVRCIQSVCDCCIVVANRQKGYPVLTDVEYVEDRFKQCGPLGGIEAGLAAVNTDFAVIVACDMPAISASFIRCCFNEVDQKSDVVWVPGQPLQAVYRRDICLQRARTCLEQGDYSLQNFLLGLRLKELSWSKADIFINLNTPEDLAQYMRKRGEQYI